MGSRADLAELGRLAKCESSSKSEPWAPMLSTGSAAPRRPPGGPPGDGRKTVGKIPVGRRFV